MNTALALSLIFLFLLSVPVAVSIALASIFGITIFSSLPLLIVPQKMLTGLDSFPLMAIPFFILAGNIMTYGGVSKRLVYLTRSLIGGIQGGLASSCVITCMVFASISGSSVATTFAIGTILIPALKNLGYPVPMASTVQAASAELGVIVPPSIPMIIYGVATETSVRDMFIAGLFPGLLIGLFLIIMVQVWCRLKGYGTNDGQNVGKLWTNAYRASWSLLLPVLILGGIYGGIFTPTEAAAISVVYALIIGMFIHKEITISHLPKIFRTSVISSGIIMLIIASAHLFSYLISLSGIPVLISSWATDTFHSYIWFLLFINLTLIVVGMFIETSAAILVLAPIFAPVALSFGIDPVHFGIIMIINLAMGMITPPLGVNLFAAATVANIPVEAMFRTLIIPVLTVISALLLITYIPAISLFLVHIM
jgi:tripartite ATP-independent transporter DctM subunit